MGGIELMFMYIVVGMVAWVGKSLKAPFGSIFGLGLELVMKLVRFHSMNSYLIYGVWL